VFLIDSSSFIGLFFVLVDLHSSGLRSSCCIQNVSINSSGRCLLCSCSRLPFGVDARKCNKPASHEGVRNGKRLSYYHRLST